MRRSAATLLATTAITSCLAIAARPVRAHPGGDPASDDSIPAPPPTYKGSEVTVDERLGARVPLAARFRTSDGTPVALADVLRGELPVILTFNYSSCPMLCSLQLNGLSAALPQLDTIRLGAQFRIVTIDLEPDESLAKLAAMKARYIDRLPEAQRDRARTGWTFLAAAVPGDASQIRSVADAVGFHYAYVSERAEWAHPAALIMLAASGQVTRYVYGIDFEPAVLRESIIKAGVAEPLTAIGFMNRCYHFDPDETSHARAGVVALKIGAAGFGVLLLSTLGLLHFVRKARRGDVR
jgi:protein SCO1/2